MQSSPAEQSGWAAKLGALRYRDFRRFWFGYAISVSGLQMLWVVQGWLVYELSGSKLQLGFLGLVQVAPAVGLTFFAGVVADKVDQRRLLLATQLVQMALLAGIATVSLLEMVETWHILAFAAARVAADSFDHPTRQAMFPHLIRRDALTSAVALNAMVHPGTRVFGPALAGILLALILGQTSSAMVAAGALFILAALGHVVFAVLLLSIHLPPVRRSQGTNVFRDLAAGVGFIWRNRVFTFIIGMAFFLMFFALSSTALFPVFAKDILKTGPSGLGILFTALGVGNIAGAILAAGLGNPQRWRVMIVGGATLQGALLILFALSPWYAVSLASLVLMGIGASIFSVASQSALQLLVADEFRGRVMGIWGLTHTAVRPMGEMQFGAMAALLGAPIAVAVGGSLLVAFTLVVAGPNRRLKEMSATPVAREAPAPHHSEPSG